MRIVAALCVVLAAAALVVVSAQEDGPKYVRSADGPTLQQLLVHLEQGTTSEILTQMIDDYRIKLTSLSIAAERLAANEHNKRATFVQSIDTNLPVIQKSLDYLTEKTHSLINHIVEFDVIMRDDNFQKVENVNVMAIWNSTKGDVKATFDEFVNEYGPAKNLLVNLYHDAMLLTQSLNNECLDCDSNIRSLAKTLFVSYLKSKCVDPCAPNPCSNGAVCHRWNRDTPGYTCVCPPGTLPPTCEPILDPCTNSSCLHNGWCEDFPDRKKHRCHCVDGWEGPSCEFDHDDCSQFLCKNGGTCEDRRQNYTCHCAPGYEGRNCQKEIDECAPSPCLNNAVACIDEIANYTCICAEGFKGKSCEINIDDCSHDPAKPSCKNMGTCIDGINSFKCECPMGFAGKFCEINIDDCVPGACLNKGQCMDGINSYVCVCPDGFTGAKCEINIDDCKPNPCRHGGQCVDGIASYVCVCPPGFRGSQCEENINECLDRPCLNDGVCMDGIASYVCSCQTGFTGNRCQTKISQCATSPCKNAGTCIDKLNSFECQCPYPYTGATCERLAYLNSCSSIFAINSTAASGLYDIKPNCTAALQKVYCDMKTPGGGLTMIAYGANGRFPAFFNHQRGDWDPSKRVGAAHLQALSLVTRSTTAIISISTTNGTTPVGDATSYQYSLSFPIPEPAAQVLEPAEIDPNFPGAKCANRARYTEVKLKNVNGDLTSKLPATMYTGTANMLVNSQKCYGLVGHQNAEKSCDWLIDDSKNGYSALYMCLEDVGKGAGSGRAFDSGLVISPSSGGDPSRAALTQSAFWVSGGGSCERPCLNGGVCKSVCPDQCDCSNTGYSGPYCETPGEKNGAALLSSGRKAFLKFLDLQGQQLPVPDGPKGYRGEMMCDMQSYESDNCYNLASSGCALDAGCIGFSVNYAAPKLPRIVLLGMEALPIQAVNVKTDSTKWFLWILKDLRTKGGPVLDKATPVTV